MNHPHIKPALYIIKKLVALGYQALFAGGCVRDMLWDSREAGDIDIATSAPPEAVAGLFEHTIGVGAHFGVVVVVVEGIQFEVATFRTDRGISDGRHPQAVTFTDARNDALRRDFTINGLFYDPLTDAVLDYVNGAVDLDKKIIRCIGDPALRFAEDYLRLMRAVRFAARFECAIDKGTLAAIQACTAGIRRISAERIFMELQKMLLNPHADRAFILLRASGLLPVILPEIEALVAVEQPAQFHPEGTVFEHTLKILSLLNKPSPLLAWSALLHDIGKPATMYVSDRIRFNNHHRVGANLALEVLRRLKASNELIDGIYTCIDNHMHFMNVKSMRLSTLKKFLARPTMDTELELHRIDCLASHGNLDNYEFLLIKRAELSAEEIKPAALIRGRHLLELGFTPGPVFKEILDAVYDLQLDETITSLDQAVAWVKEHYILPHPCT